MCRTPTARRTQAQHGTRVYRLLCRLHCTCRTAFLCDCLCFPSTCSLPVESGLARYLSQFHRSSGLYNRSSTTSWPEINLTYYYPRRPASCPRTDALLLVVCKAQNLSACEFLCENTCPTQKGQVLGVGAEHVSTDYGCQVATHSSLPSPSSPTHSLTPTLSTSTPKSHSHSSSAWCW